VLPAINLDDQPSRGTEEVHDVGANLASAGESEDQRCRAFAIAAKARIRPAALRCALFSRSDGSRPALFVVAFPLSKSSEQAR
jgi:hypothetical protein